MPNQCQRCGNSEIYYRILDEGTSEELYRCTDCGYRHDFPDVPNSSVMTAAAEIAAETGAAFLLRIDQTNNVSLKHHATGKLSAAMSGVCSAMTKAWITCNLKSARGADDCFRQVILANLKQLAVDQSAQMSEIDGKRKLAEQKNEAVSAYQQLTGSLKHPDSLPPVMREGYIDLGVQEERQTLYRKAKLLMNLVEEAYQGEIDRMSSGLKRGTELCSERPLSGLEDMIRNASVGFYVISLAPAGSWVKRLLLTGSLATTGHIFGIQVGNPRMRLMDPNTGLWACDSQSDLADLVRAHVEKFYDVVGMFKAGTFDLWKFAAA